MTSNIKKIVDAAENLSAMTGVSTEKIIEKGLAEVQKNKSDSPGPGHNSGKYDPGEAVDKATASRLKSIIERVERLEEEKAGLSEDIKEVFGEAKATGFDVKIIRQVIRLRKIELDKRREDEMLLDTYKSAIGME